MWEMKIYVQRTVSIFRFASLMFAMALCSTVLNAGGSANEKTITAEELLHTLQTKNRGKPLLFFVGPRLLYTQAHIVGAELIGQGSSPEGIQHLRQRAGNLRRNTAIVLYCGCCPWSHCPNVDPAYLALQELGFTNVKVLYLPNNFGTDWVDKGYPAARGE